MAIAADLRHALRLLRKHPLTIAVAILTLALGIGANTAMFSLLRQVFVSNFQYKDLETLVIVQSKRLQGGGQPGGVSAPDMLDFRDQNNVFEGVGTFRFTQYVLASQGGTAVAIRGIYVTPSLLTVLGVPPVLGRLFREDEGQPGNDLAVILSEGYWTREHARDPQVIGKQLRLNGRLHSIAGVMPASFFREGELFTPLVISQDERNIAARGERGLRVWARLKPGVTVKQAESGLSAIAARLAEQFPDTNGNWGVHMLRPKEVVAQQLGIAGVIYYLPVAFVLLIACANVAHLQLARALEREKEVALRTALGAGRFRIMRQLLTESVLIGLLGGLAGLGVAWYAMQWLQNTLPPEFTRGVGGLRLNGEVLWFMLAIAVFSGVLFGFAPAWKASRASIHDTSKEGGKPSMARGGKRLRQAMIISEIALTTVLLGGAGLALSMTGGRAYSEMGFNHANVLSAATLLQSARYAKPEARRAFATDLSARLAALPGVRSATVASGMPLLGGGGSPRQLARPGDKDAGVRRQSVAYQAVDHAYFQTLEVPAVAGRLFAASDREGAAPVVVVNEELVRQYFAQGNPIGERIVLNPATRPGASPNDPPAKPEPAREIIGVVKNVKQTPVDILPQPAIAYVPYAQDPQGYVTVAVRTEGSAAAMTAQVADQIQASAPDISIFQIGAMDRLLQEQLRLLRFLPTILSALALLGLILAGAGTYGTTAYSMAQRTREFGIRMALGARPAQVLGTVVKQGLWLTATGFALGAAGTYALIRILISVLPPQGPQAPELLTNSEIAVTCGVAMLLLASIGLIATYFPARRATAIDPVAAMRNE